MSVHASNWFENSPRLDLRGKVALVTGASKGIGLAIATSFAAAGAGVMISSRKHDALAAAAAGISEQYAGAAVSTFAANAGEPGQSEACVKATIDRFGALDVLVNNAATNPTIGPVLDASIGAWDKTFQVNVRGVYVWTQLAWRSWMQQHGGTVINISSTGGIRHGSAIGVYNTTKAAVIHLTEVLACELAPRVRVNAIAPGLVRTDFSRPLWERNPDIGDRIPLGRIGTPEDIAHAALFLASDLAAWITGHTLVLDGGALIQRNPG